MTDPLLAPLVALAGGILVARYADFTLVEAVSGAAALGALALAARRWVSRRTARYACLAALIFAGVTVAVWHRPGPAPELDAAASEIVLLAGCVVEPPVFHEDREQFLLELAPQARARVTIYPRAGEKPPALDYGQRVEVEARVRRPRNYGNPGAFDYVGYLARRHVYWTAHATGVAAIRRQPGGCGSRFQAAIFGLRSTALERLERLYAGDPYATGMMQALLIGESTKLEKVWTEHFRRTGTYHALVISGLHLTVLAGFLLFLLRICRVGLSAALVLTVGASWLYALVAGWQAPVVRSAGGLTLFLIARYFYRRRRLLNLLAAVGIVFLLIDPEQMFEASFQLSFLSVAAIGALVVPLIEGTSGPLARGLRGLHEAGRDPHLEPRTAQIRVEVRLLAEAVCLWSRIPARWVLPVMALLLRAVVFFYELLIISMVVQFGLALPMVVYFHRVSLSGLSANLLVVPALNIAVPAGFVAIFTGWTFPARAAGWLLRFSQWVVDWHANWEPRWRVPDPPLWLALSCAAALLLLAFSTRARRQWRRVTFLLALAAFGLLVWHPFAPRLEPGTLELTAIDVGQGDSELVAFPDGKLMVVDGGGILTFGRRPRSGLDPGEDVVSPYLWSRAIRRLDVLALTHAHADHIDGLAALIDNFRPGELWTGVTPATPAWLRLRDRALASGTRIVTRREGERFRYGEVLLEVLAAGGDATGRTAAHNNDSLVLRMRHGAHTFLLTGDVERAVEARLVTDDVVGKVDVLKVAHHGSRTSSTESFLAATRPSVALISAGFENSYRHPHAEVLERFAQRRTAVLRTDLWGLITVSSDGRRLRIDTNRWSGARANQAGPF